MVTESEIDVGAAQELKSDCLSAAPPFKGLVIILAALVACFLLFDCTNFVSSPLPYNAQKRGRQPNAMHRPLSVH